MLLSAIQRNQFDFWDFCKDLTKSRIYHFFKLGLFFIKALQYILIDLKLKIVLFEFILELCNLFRLLLMFGFVFFDLFAKFFHCLSILSYNIILWRCYDFIYFSWWNLFGEFELTENLNNPSSILLFIAGIEHIGRTWSFMRGEVQIWLISFQFWYHLFNETAP